jgi:hypothetical protein
VATIVTDGLTEQARRDAETELFPIDFCHALA